ncbi:slowpoke-binding protein-like [Patiria miniata]|uniref:WH2 domain-containing protein n=1 Tax=Patiria miniata TaxID=46514 RepID=A0A913ZEK0_PATMI|nr:slowpoke-binding protein-like [Patiria miniata]
MTDFWTENYWVAILIGVGGLILLILILIAAIFCYRRCSRYDYTPLRDYMSLPAKLQKEKKMERDTVRETALLNCQFYLRAHAGKYTFSEHLPDMGSRVDKHWFLVRYASQNKDVLLSTCNKATNCTIPFTSNTHKVLRELLKCVKHPYLWPVLDIDLLEEQDMEVLIQSYNSRGSLKDYIYHEKPHQDWDNKYGVKGRGLALKEIQLFGRQVLEALLYLQDGGFPQHCHVQAGNIILQKGTCKLSGYENILLGHTSRLFPVLCKKLKEIPEVFDSLAFGHLLYEMGAGSALEDTVAIPERSHFNKLKHQQVVEILEFIFDANGAYPSLREIAEHDFFQNVRLKELEKKPPTEIHLTSAMKNLLKTVKKGRILKTQSIRRGTPSKHTRSKRRSSGSSLKSNEAETVLSQEPVNNGTLPSASDGYASSRVTPIPAAITPTPPQAAPLAPPPPAVAVVTPRAQPNLPSISEERSSLLSDIRKGLTLRPTGTSQNV